MSEQYRAISEHFRDKGLIMKHYINSSVYFTLHTWQITASLPLPLAANNFSRPTSLHSRFQELAQVWVIDHSLLLDRVSGVADLSTNMILNFISWSSIGC